MTDLSDYMTTRISNYAPGPTDGGAETLQTIRQRDYNALDPHATLVIVDQAITYLRTRREAITEEATRLEQLRPVLATPHWRKDRHGQPRYLYLIHPTQGPSTSPFDFAQDELRAGSAHGGGSTSAPTPRPGLQPWLVSKPGMNSRPPRVRCVR